MSSETDEVRESATGLVQAMAKLVRAMDAVGDDGEAAAHIPEGVDEALGTLAERVSAAKGFTA